VVVDPHREGVRPIVVVPVLGRLAQHAALALEADEVRR